MTSPMSVTVEGMQQATGDLDTARSSAMNDRTRIEGETQALRGAWTGDAADTFQLAANAWLAHMSSIIQGLDSLRNAMESGGANYKQTHQTTTDSASQAQSVVSSVALPAGLVF